MKTILKTLCFTAVLSFGAFANAYTQKTYIPDDNFEQHLIDVGIAASRVLDDSVLTSRINTLTTLSVDGEEIKDLTGIEDFVALTSLYCFDNDLSSLDVSTIPNLFELHCNENQITALDLSKNTALWSLNCSDNLLETLDVSKNIELAGLRCNSNKLISLDISQNTKMKSFFCFSNKLTYLNVKNGNNTNISYFHSEDNPDLTCIEVDDAAWSTTNWPNVDTASSFSNNCGALSIVAPEQIVFNIYPNPATHSLTISIQTSASYCLLTDNGQVIKEGNLNEGENTLNVSSLPNGTYFLQVKSAKGISVKKLVKE
jgi:hypothetical protein